MYEYFTQPSPNNTYNATKTSLNTKYKTGLDAI